MPSRRPDSHLEISPDLQLERIVSLKEAVELSGISADTWRRHHAHLIRRLSPRRLGIKLRDVVSVGGVESRAA